MRVVLFPVFCKMPDWAGSWDLLVQLVRTVHTHYKLLEIVAAALTYPRYEYPLQDSAHPDPSSS